MFSNTEVGLHARDCWQVLRNRWPLVALCFGVVFLSVLAITYVMPTKYRGRVMVEISQPRPDGGPVLGGGADPAAAPVSARYVENQFDIITSKEVLGRVVDQLGLRERWGVDGRLEAIRQLEGMVDTDQRRGTDMIDIEVLHTDPAVAAELANAVAAAYEERRRELFAARLEEVEATLAVEEGEQAEKVRLAHQRFLGLAERLGVENIDPVRLAQLGEADGTGGVADLSSEMQREVFAAERTLRTAESRMLAIDELEGDQLIRTAVPMGLGEASLAARYGDYKELQLVQIDLREQGVGSQHPRQIAVAEKLEAVRGQLLDAAQELKDGLRQGVEIARAEHVRLEEMYAALQERSLGARRANTEFIAAARDYQIQLETLRDLKRRLEMRRIDEAVDPVVTQVHERAETDDQPVWPKVSLNLALGASLGLALGVGLAFFFEYLDTSAKNLDQVEALLDAPVLAVVPKDIGLMHEAGAAHPDAEAYRILRTNLEFNRRPEGAAGDSIAVLSTAAGEGKSTTVINFATVCARGGCSVLVIDADLRRPRLHTLFGIGNSVGLSNYLAADVGLQDVVLRTPVEGLYFIPSGVVPADGAGLLNSGRLAKLLEEARARFDLVLVDSPPVLGVSDASVLAGAVDGVVLVVQQGKLPAEMVVKAKKAIDRSGGKLIGAVLNNVDLRSDSQYQYYTSYYTYYSPAERAEEDPKPSPSRQAGRREREREDVF